jgi:hypothetical protein
MKKSLEEWIEYYEEKSQSRFRLSKGEKIVFDEEKGFFSYYIVPEREAVEIPKMVGEGRYWAKEIRKMVVALGLKKALFFTKRNPATWIRTYGGRVYGYYMEIPLEEAKQI